MESGSAPSLPGYGSADLYQGAYDELATEAGCAGPASFECLKALPAEDLLAAQTRMTASGFKATWG